jgi:cellulose biosynthesis protein BcsQ
MKQPLFIAFSTQKGGVGKTTFSTLAASYLHYEKGYNVAVIDCDYPQWSIHSMRKREAEQLQTNTYYQNKAVALFESLGKGAYPVICTNPDNELSHGQRSSYRKNRQRMTSCCSTCPEQSITGE